MDPDNVSEESCGVVKDVNRKNCQLSEDIDYTEIKEKSSSQSLQTRNPFNISHRFATRNFKLIKFCNYCKALMMGLGRQGLHCTVCKINVHKRCQPSVPNNCRIHITKMPKASPTFNISLLPTKSQLSYSKLKNQIPEYSTASDSSSGSIDTSSFEVGFSNESQNIIKAGNCSKLCVQSEQKPVTKLQKNVYTFVTVLNRGNFGKVMLAKKNNTDEIYAVKVLKKHLLIEENALNFVMTEKKILSSVAKHPFLISLYRCFQTKDRFIFVMEYLSGGSLMFYIQKRGKFNESRACFYAAEVTLALQFLHQYDIVYRNLKLEHILLDAEGHCKLIDFGISKEGISNNKGANSICGTPKSMAPEILQQLSYGLSVDWWALGVLLYEMVVGKAPFDADNIVDLYKKIINDNVVFPRRLNKATVSILLGLLTKNPDQRLGCVPKDNMEAAIFTHTFFKDIDWVALEQRKIKPPFKPKIKNENKALNFDKKFTNEAPVLTPIDLNFVCMEQREFKDFSFIRQDLDLRCCSVNVTPDKKA